MYESWKGPMMTSNLVISAFLSPQHPVEAMDNILQDRTPGMEVAALL